MPSGFPDAVRDLGIDLDAATLDRFGRYRDLIAEAAVRFSLTAVRDPAGIERRHFLESLALGRLLASQGLLHEGTRLLDIGSGAGLPGLPLKLAWPRLRLSLLESNAKRAGFLRRVIEDLALDDAEVLEGRAEDLGRDPAQRESYDLVTARAVAPLPVLIEYALPFLRLDGRLAALKGSGVPRELEDAAGGLSELGGSVEASLPFEPPDGMPQTLVIIRKTAPTPDRYPRRAGIPAKRPLA
ncbi:MAG: 16S rRNA (guanine(527)-N(7))-methyltransferase RsmG [Dehalococcoidia bacterium]|nr:16S rRNA (guanine(527)-N(7))-methyltransferase RsmG [Dehalococcoidia bacterium]